MPLTWDNLGTGLLLQFGRDLEQIGSLMLSGGNIRILKQHLRWGSQRSWEASGARNTSVQDNWGYDVFDLMMISMLRYELYQLPDLH